MSDDLKERLRANHLDECYEAIDRIEELETDLKNSKISEIFWRDGWAALDDDKRAVEAKLEEQIEWVKGLSGNLIASEVREARLKDKLAKAMEAMKQAHVLMRECGWQLAPSADRIGDGVLELAVADVEEKFSRIIAELEATNDPS